MPKYPKIGQLWVAIESPGLISFDIWRLQIIIWAFVNTKNDMTLSRTLEVSPQKFDKLASTYGQVLPYARQGPDLENFIFNFLYAEFYCGHFKPITDE